MMWEGHQCFRVFVLLLLQCLINPSTSLGNITFECSGSWELMGTHCYKFIDVNLDFEDALDVCEKYGSALLTVRDEVESRAVADVAKNKFQSDHYWINNYHNPGEEVEHESPFDNKCNGMWQPNQPTEPLDSEEDFAVASNFYGRWAVRWIYNNLPFVCRAPACSEGSFRCSDGTCINEKWRCDGVPDCSDLSDENECPDLSDCFKHYKQSSGTIDTQNFSDNDNCQWIIEGEPGDVLRIEFETLKLDDNVDSVMIFTGGPSIKTSELVMEVRKDITEKLILFARNHYFIVILRSYATDVKAEIKAQWIADQELTRGQVVDLTATNVHQYMFTPYHNSSFVPKNYKREFLITAPEGEIITMKVIHSTFDLRNQEEDFVAALNHGFELYDDVNNRGVWISKSNQMSVIVKINNNENRVIRAMFKIGCDFRISVSYAEFLADSLPGNITCDWIVENQLGTHFSLAVSSKFNDLEDSIIVFNGTELNERAAVFTLSRTRWELPELLNLYNGVSFQYISDIAQPNNTFGGWISPDCLPIPDTSHMNIMPYSHMYTWKYNITCEVGYSFSQEEYYSTHTLIGSCDKRGNWDWGSSAYTRFPACQVVYCGVPPPIENGFIDSIDGNVSYQSIAKYRCADGFTLQGQQSVTCQADGSWTGGPQCKAGKCDPVPQLQHGFYNVDYGNESTSSIGTIVRYNCETGFHLRGAQQIACLPQEDWSAGAPSCEKIFCPFLKIQNGVYKTSKPSKEPPLFEESVTLECNDGYVINRTQTPEDNNITCGGDGQYNPIDDTCGDLNECDTGKHNCSNTQECFNVEGSFVCVCKRGYFGSNCTEMNNTNVCEHLPCSDCGTDYECDCYDGYSLYTANGTEGYFLPEGEDGTRAGDVYHKGYSCVPKQCTEAPKDPNNGKVLTTRSSFHLNETVDFICDFGYKLNGPASSSCGKNGMFDISSQTPACIKQKCSVESIDKQKYEVSRIPSSGDLEPGDSLIIQCVLNDGSGKMTNRTLYCAQDPDNHESFTLQGDSPMCPEVNCGKTLNIPGAKHDTVTNTTYGSFFEFGCDASRGFKPLGKSLLGNMTVICQRNGLWGYANLTCEGPQCGDPGTRAGTIQIVETSYEIDQKVHYNCTQEGFKPYPNDTLICEYISVNGSAEWSEVAPVCIDMQKPYLTCPENQELNLYDTIFYKLPQVSDNSGYSCLTLESGPPSGISVVSQALNILYKAKDRELENTCTFNITLSDRTGPEIQCPSDKVIDVVFGSPQMENITKDILVSPSDDGVITMNSEEMISVAVGDVIPIRFNITKENGLSKGCAFLVRGVSTTCKNDSLTPPLNGKLVCDSHMSCNASCDSGYAFQDLTEIMSYTCQNGIWSPAQSVKPCIRLMNTISEYSVTIIYSVNGSMLIGFDDRTFSEPHKCSNSHYANISSRAASLSECGFTSFSAKNFKSEYRTYNQIEVSFVLTVSTANGNITALKECATTLKENSETLFGPTNPTTNTTGKTCLPPWTVQKDLDDTKFNASNEFACDTLAQVVDIEGVKHCLPCGPGTYYDSGSKTCKACNNGFYQDMEGQSSCKKCPKFVMDSSLPRTQEEHCFATCPEGFWSSSGYLEDGCTQCSEDTYNNGSTISCVACPDGGSTKGISGAYSSSQCFAPCQPGEYSITGYMPCNQCPKNFYSDTTNATMCLECSSTEYTISTGSQSKASCLSDDSPCIDFCVGEGTDNSMPCEIKDHRPVCSCVPGYHGDKCDFKCDLCQPNPCYNGGTCESDGKNFTCKCPLETNCKFKDDPLLLPTTSETCAYDIIPEQKNFSGTDCETMCSKNNNCVAYLIEPTKSDLLNCYLYKQLCYDETKNRGEEIKAAKKVCTDKKFFDGRQCEEDLTDDCNDNVCSEKNFCKDLVNDTQCVCPQGDSYDAQCRKADDLCSNSPCKNDGQCVSYDSVRYTCECKSGFTGSNCETNIDDCKDNPSGCLYGGQCTDGIDGYSCTCGNGFYGDHCEGMEDLCAQNSCGDDGFCYTDYKHFTANCSCGVNYILDPDSSNSCVAIKYCDSQPCKNGATCSDYIGGFTCQCPTGYEGSLCQHNIDDCATNPCQNGATCQDGIDAFSCKCLLGYSGDTCSENVDDCITCQNNGTCEDKFNDYICHCPKEYAGKNCSEDYNECEQIKPCLHGGICNNTMGGYNCMCPSGWTGMNCEVVMDFCSENNPCKNLGNCYNLHNGTYCQCLPGTFGNQCEMREEICSTFSGQICLNGNCTLEGGSATCKCDGKEVYTGKSCELEKFYCKEDICNGGMCKIDGMQYECSCDKGENCDQMEDVCKTLMCPETISCNTYINSDGFYTPVCNCPATQIFAGNECKEVDTDFDLAFLKDFPNQNMWVTSERGFFFEKGSDISVAMWVVAAQDIDDNDPVLALSRSEDDDDAFLLIYNQRIKFGRNGTDFGFSSLDKENKWHFISVSWRADGNYQVVFDVTTLTNFDDSKHAMGFPVSDMYVFVHLGYKFHGYISQVSVWNSILTTNESLIMSGDRKNLAKKNNLLLGWTLYTYNDMVRNTEKSTAATGVFICDIDNTIATLPCDSNSGSMDKSPPMLRETCEREKTFMIDYSRHQMSIKDLYTFGAENGNTLEKMVYPDLTVSFGAFDTAFALQDDEGNTGICMTRIYVTPNNCSDTEPSHTVTQDCLDNGGMNKGKEVKCPEGQMPSVPTPKFLVCGQLQSYNLNNMYEKPDRVVCGDTKERDTTVYGSVTYTVVPECQGSTTTDALSDKVKTLIMDYCKPWNSTNSTACSSVTVTGVCENSNVKLSLEIGGFSAILSNNNSPDLKLTPLELIQRAFATKTELDASSVALAELVTTTVMITDETFCEYGYTLTEGHCVQCGPGSHFDEMTKTCKLCELNMYSDKPGQKSCTLCPSNNSTLHRGSNDESDCKKKCMRGEMLNMTTEECEACPKNFYQNQEGKDYCFPCPPSSGTETIGATSPNDCVDFCPPGTQVRGTECIGCPRGFYRSGENQDQCQKCSQANVTTRVVNSTSEDDCIIPICSSGNFVNESTSMPFCQLCELGTYQPELAQLECISCGANFTTVDTGSVNKSQCVLSCPPGHEEYPIGSPTCRPCLRGYYRSSHFDDRFRICTMCPANFTTMKPGAVSANDCKVPICKAGTKLNISMYECVECPLNSYQDMELKDYCEPCPEGKKTQQTGSDSEDDCKLVCQAGYGITGDKCEICKQGFWNNANFTMRFEQCQQCPDTYTTEVLEGAIDIANCSVRDCPPGTFIDSTSDDACTECATGFYQPERRKPNCLLCPSNTNTSGPGSKNETECTVYCPPGKEGNETDDCVPCREDTFKAESGFGLCDPCTGDGTSTSADRTSCQEVFCDKGREYINGTCRNCAVGFYKSMRGNTQCESCPANRTTAMEGSKDCTLISCYEGYYRKDRQTCTPCGLGTYQNETDQVSCKLCPRISNHESTTNQTASTKEDDCLPLCSAGFYLVMDERKCAKCDYGFYKDEESTIDNLDIGCKQCRINTTDIMGATSELDCKFPNCNRGNFRRRGSLECEKCPKGTYQNMDNVGNVANCTDCRSGTTTFIEGATSEDYCRTKCGVGQEYSLSTHNCTSCRVGEFKNESMEFCKYCPDGQTTLMAGESSCTPTEATAEPVKKIDVQVTVQVNVGSCDNIPFTERIISIIVVYILQNQRNERYIGLCPSPLCSNVEISIVNICGSRRKKRQTDNSGTATVDVIVSNVDSRLDSSDDSDLARDTKRVVEEAFYDQTPVEQILEDNLLTITSVLIGCPPGHIFDASGNCESCKSGQYSVNDTQCEECPTNTYSTNPVSGSCTRCPVNKITEQTGSSQLSDCIVNCSVGSFRNTSTNTCVGCSQGSYQDLPGQTSCKSCPSNYNTKSDNSTMETDCLISCNKGSYREDRTTCRPCAKGTYQNETDQDSCEPCPRISNHDSTTNQESSTKEDDCLPVCSAGFYLNINERACAECDYGFYKDAKSPQDNLDLGCTRCSEGTTNKIGATSQLDCRIPKCSKGEFLNSTSLQCEECPIGKYQGRDKTENVTSCTDCKSGTTTFIKGATSEDYCRKKCDPGQEYSFSSNSCTPCEVGQFRNSNMEFCRYCPQGQTTLKAGESRCIPTLATPEPTEQIDVRVTVQISVESCGNLIPTRLAIRNVVLILIQNQRNQKYNGLCPSDDRCTNVQINILSICEASRRKRQAESGGTATVEVLVKDVESRVVSNDDAVLARDTRKAVQEAFYDLTPVEETLDTNGLIIRSAFISCPAGQTLDDASGNCESCKSGQYSVSDSQCEECPKNTYSTNPVSDSCTPCPEDKVTRKSGSSQSSECIVRENDSHLNLVAGIAGGIGACLLLLLVIVGLCAHKRRRNRNSTSKSLASETDGVDYNQPFYNPVYMDIDPTMFQAETLDLPDQNPSIYIRNSGASSQDINGDRRGRSRTSQKERDW